MIAATFGRAPLIQVAKSVRLDRVYGAARAPRWYGRRDATSRWDDPDGDFGVLYLGRSPVGAFAETLLLTRTDREVLWSRVRQNRQAAFKVLEPLQLAKLHGEGLAWFGVTAAQIAEADYAVPQSLARRIHADFPVDGIQYRSRFDNDELCVALFDRADGKLELAAEGWAYRQGLDVRGSVPAGVSADRLLGWRAKENGPQLATYSSGSFAGFAGANFGRGTPSL